MSCILTSQSLAAPRCMEQQCQKWLPLYFLQEWRSCWTLLGVKKQIFPYLISTMGLLRTAPVFHAGFQVQEGGHRIRRQILPSMPLPGLILSVVHPSSISSTHPVLSASPQTGMETYIGCYRNVSSEHRGQCQLVLASILALRVKHWQENALLYMLYCRIRPYLSQIVKGSNVTK